MAADDDDSNMKTKKRKGARSVSFCGIPCSSSSSSSSFPSARPQVRWLLLHLLCMCLSLWTSWHTWNFASTSVDEFRLALVEPVPVVTLAPVPFPPPSPPSVLTFSCSVCHPLPMNHSLFTCVECARPEPPPNTNQTKWETRMTRRVLARQALNRYYHEHTWLFRDYVCTLSDGHGCPFSFLDAFLTHFVLDVDAVRVHPTATLSLLSFLSTLLLWIPLRIGHFVHAMKRAKRDEEAKAQQERDEAQRAANTLAFAQAHHMSMLPDPTSFGLHQRAAAAAAEPVPSL